MAFTVCLSKSPGLVLGFAASGSISVSRNFASGLVAACRNVLRVGFALIFHVISGPASDKKAGESAAIGPTTLFALLGFLVVFPKLSSFFLDRLLTWQ